MHGVAGFGGVMNPHSAEETLRINPAFLARVQATVARCRVAEDLETLFFGPARSAILAAARRLAAAGDGVVQVLSLGV